jgi:hypothetical protein
MPRAKRPTPRERLAVKLIAAFAEKGIEIDEDFAITCPEGGEKRHDVYRWSAFPMAGNVPHTVDSFDTVTECARGFRLEPALHGTSTQWDAHATRP